MKALFPAVRIAVSLLLALALSAPALTQDPAPSLTKDVHEQMRNLIVQIEKGLGHVDKLLWSVDAPLGEGEHPSIASRLAAARERSQKVLDDIDLLLEIRHHPHGQGGT